MSGTRLPARLLVGTCLVGAIAAVAVYFALETPGQQSAQTQPTANTPGPDSLRVVDSRDGTVELTPQLIRTLGVRTSQVQPAGSHDRLRLSGSLILDSNRMVRVHSRFAGEVV